MFRTAFCKTEYKNLSGVLIMGILSKLRLSSRMQLLVGLTLVGLLLLCITALFQLKHTMLEDRMQKTRNLVEVDPKCASLDYVRGEPRQTKVDVVMTNNFAFGGINTSLVLKRV